MARGWESKEVESQIESAAEERGNRRHEVQLTPEEAQIQRERELLESAKARVAAQLNNPALHPRHGAMLEAALGDLEAKLDHPKADSP